MKNFTKAALAATALGIVLLFSDSNSKKTKNLEQKTGINIVISEFSDVNLPKKHIAPEKLQACITSYDAPFLTDSIGKILDAKLGYFKDGDFVVPTEIGERYLARHIQKLEDIFQSPHPYIPDYYWNISIKKPEEKRNINYVKEFSKGLKLKSGMLIFPSLNYGKYCKFTSPDIILVWNTGINGLYKDPNSTSEKPEHYLHYVQNVLKLEKP